MDRIEPEAFRFFCPLFADELVRREPLEGLEPAAEVVGGNEVVKVLSELNATKHDRRAVKRCWRQHSMISATNPSTVQIRSGTLSHAVWINQSTATTIRE